MRDLYFSAGLFVAGLIFVGMVRADGPWPPVDCQLPSFNWKKCAVVIGDVHSCTGWNQSDCGNKAKHQIRNFPAGVFATNIGTTSEIQAQCFKKKYCEWIPQSGGGGDCVLSETWTGWEKRPKIVIDSFWVCENEEDYEEL